MFNTTTTPSQSNEAAVIFYGEEHYKADFRLNCELLKLPYMFAQSLQEACAKVLARSMLLCVASSTVNVDNLYSQLNARSELRSLLVLNIDRNICQYQTPQGCRYCSRQISSNLFPVVGFQACGFSLQTIVHVYTQLGDVSLILNNHPQPKFGKGRCQYLGPIAYLDGQQVKHIKGIRFAIWKALVDYSDGISWEDLFRQVYKPANYPNRILTNDLETLKSHIGHLNRVLREEAAASGLPVIQVVGQNRHFYLR